MEKSDYSKAETPEERKIAQLKASKAYYEANREKQLAYHKEYREKNKDYFIDYSREYRQNNPDKMREYRENNKEKIKNFRNIHNQKPFKCLICSKEMKMQNKYYHFKKFHPAN